MRAMMTSSIPRKAVQYEVLDGRPITFSVLVGEQQSGGSVAYLGTALAAQGLEIHDHELGDGAALRGRVLVVSTAVVDVRPEHDRTSVVVRVRGGSPDALDVMQSQETTPGGAVNYLTVVRFV